LGLKLGSYRGALGSWDGWKARGQGIFTYPPLICPCYAREEKWPGNPASTTVYISLSMCLYVGKHGGVKRVVHELQDILK